MDIKKWYNIWEYSGEHINELVRQNKIVDNEIIFDNPNPNSLEKKTLEIYRDTLSNMNDELNNNKFDSDILLYRNIFDDIFFRLDIGDFFDSKTFISCFPDKNKELLEYGNYELTLIVHKGINYLKYNNIIILPPGKLKIIERSKYGYVIEYIEMDNYLKLTEDKLQELEYQELEKLKEIELIKKQELEKIKNQINSISRSKK